MTLSPTSLYLARSHKSEPWSYSFFLWQYFFFESVSTYLIVMGISNVICPLSLYFVNALSVHLAFSPPNPPVKRQDCCTGTPEKDSLFEQRVQLITFLSKVNFIALPPTILWSYYSPLCGSLRVWIQLAHYLRTISLFLVQWPSRRANQIVSGVFNIWFWSLGRHLRSFLLFCGYGLFIHILNMIITQLIY